jgi:hypothetical protein
MTACTIAKQIRLEQHSPSHWRIAFDHPPLPTQNLTYHKEITALLMIAP